MKNKLEDNDKVDLMALYLAKRWTSGEEVDTTQDIIKAKELLEDKLNKNGGEKTS